MLFCPQPPSAIPTKVSTSPPPEPSRAPNTLLCWEPKPQFHRQTLLPLAECQQFTPFHYSRGRQHLPAPSSHHITIVAAGISHQDTGAWLMDTLFHLHCISGVLMFLYLKTYQLMESLSLETFLRRSNYSHALTNNMCAGDI